MRNKEYNKLGKLYVEMGRYCDLMDSFSSPVFGLVLIDIARFSDILNNIKKWQDANKIPEHKKIRISTKTLYYLNELNAGGVRFNVSKKQEDEAYIQIKDDAKVILQKIEILLDYYSEKIEVDRKTPMIAFDNGRIVDRNNGVEIHKYSTQNKAYYFAEYIFKKEKNDWVYYQDIVDGAFSDWEDDSTIDCKRTLYDIVRGVNKWSREKIGIDIIENDKKEKYRVIY